MTELHSEPLYRAHIDVEGFYEVGRTFRGTRTIVRVKGGWFEGPEVKGTILPGTGDVRDTYQTDDGAIIYVSYRGILDISDDVWARIRAGEDVPAEEYYLRTQPMFETGSEKYDWLNKTLAVGVGKQEAMGVTYDVFRIL
jgi:Protein of unknown function (DUF3237)